MKIHLMPIQFFAPEISFVHTPVQHLAFKGKSAAALKNVTRLIPSADKLTGVELRLLPPYINDNNTPKIFPFPGFARLYCLTIVVSDANNQLVGGIDLQGFPRIGDKEYLPLNKTIFYWQQNATDAVPPSQIHTMCSVIKSKKGLREVGKIMTELKKDEDYKGIVKTLAGLASNAVAAGAALDIITQLASVVGKYLGSVEDKPIGTIVNSFTALYGDFDTIGVTRKTYPTRKVNFEVELIVRDHQPGAGAPATSSRGKLFKGFAEATVGKATGEEVIVDLIPLV
jgi:hypothetical protein